MVIESISCGFPFCGNHSDEQAACSLVIRTVAIGLAVIALIVGMMALNGISELRILGTPGGASLTAAGSVILLAGIFFRCNKKNLKNDAEAAPPQQVRRCKRTLNLGGSAHSLAETQQALDFFEHHSQPPAGISSHDDWRTQRLQSREVVTQQLAAIFKEGVEKKASVSLAAVVCLLYESKLSVYLTLPSQNFLKCKVPSSFTWVKHSPQHDIIPLTFIWPQEGNFEQRASCVGEQLDMFMQWWPQMKEKIASICYEDSQYTMLLFKTITQAQFSLKIGSISINQEKISLSGSLHMQTTKLKQGFLQDRFSLKINLDLTIVCNLQNSTIHLNIVPPKKAFLRCEGCLGGTTNLEKGDSIALNFTWQPDIELPIKHIWEQLDRVVEWWPQIRRRLQAICYEHNQCMVIPSTSITQARISLDGSSISINEEEIYLNASLRMNIMEIENFPYELDHFSLGISLNNLTIDNISSDIQSEIKKIFSNRFDKEIIKRFERGRALASLNLSYFWGSQEEDKPEKVVSISLEEIAQLDQLCKLEDKLIAAFENNNKNQGLTLLKKALLKTHPDHAAHLNLDPKEQTDKFTEAINSINKAKTFFQLLPDDNAI